MVGERLWEGQREGEKETERDSEGEWERILTFCPEKDFNCQ